MNKNSGHRQLKTKRTNFLIKIRYLGIGNVINN